MVSLDAALDAHEVAVRARVDALREEALRVAAALDEAEGALQRVEVARATIREALAGVVGLGAGRGPAVSAAVCPSDGTLGSRFVPLRRADLTEDALPEYYRRVWCVLRDAGPAKAAELAERLGLEVSVAKVEGLRSKLKRLVARGWIAEPRPGVFALPVMG
jgi:hypothetical protein